MQEDEVEHDEGTFFPELDPVDTMLTALAASPQSSAAPLPPTPPPAHLLSPRNTARPSSSPHPSPSAARRGCFGPRVNGFAYPLPRRARERSGVSGTGGVVRFSERGTASVPARLLQDPDVPALIELPGTLHGFSNNASASLTRAGGSVGGGGGAGFGSAAPSAAAAAATAAAVGMNPGALLAGVDYAASLGGYRPRGISRGKREAAPMPMQGTSSDSVCSDWEQVTRQPLQLDSDMQVFQVPDEWAGRFRSARTLDERYELVEELESIGRAYIEHMKKERSDAYYQRMHSMRDLPAATKVTIRGRIHSKLNPFVKEKSAEVHKVIRSYLLESIPFPQ